MASMLSSYCGVSSNRLRTTRASMSDTADSGVVDAATSLGKDFRFETAPVPVEFRATSSVGSPGLDGILKVL